MDKDQEIINNAHNAIFGMYKLHILKDDEVIECDMCIGTNGELIFHQDEHQINSNMVFYIKSDDIEVMVKGDLMDIAVEDEYGDQFANYYPHKESLDSLKVLKPNKFTVSENDYDDHDFNLANLFGGEVENRMVEHMNDDHVDAIKDYCNFAGVEMGSNDPSMIGVDQRGFDLLVDNKPVRFTFDNTCETPVEVREALVDLAKRSRA